VGFDNGCFRLVPGLGVPFLDRRAPGSGPCSQKTARRVCTAFCSNSLCRLLAFTEVEAVSTRRLQPRKIPRRQRAVETRQRLLKAAARVFSE